MKLQLLLTLFLLSYLICIALAFVFKVKIMVVTSNSMQPKIQVGDVLLAFRQEQYLINDIISYRVGQSIVTHRVSGVHTFSSPNPDEEKRFFETKGDSNKSADAVLISHNQILGNVKIIIPKIGYIPLFLKSKIMEMGINPTFSFFNISAQSQDNTFLTGEWMPAHTSFILNHDQAEYSNIEKVNSYIDQHGEHFQIQVSEDNQQFLSFLYKLNSDETASHFDSPATIVFIGNTPVLQMSYNSYNDEWQRAFIDLSAFNFEQSTYDIFFTTQNNFDDLYEPSIQVKEVTTTQLFANPLSSINFTPNKKVSTLFVSYQLWQNNDQITIEEELEPVVIGQNPQFIFDIPENIFGTQITFWSVDLFNNIEPIQYIDLSVESQLSVNEFNYKLFSETQNEISIQAEYISSSYVPYFFTSRVSSNPIESDLDWLQATQMIAKNHHLYIQADIPRVYGRQTVMENLLYENIPTDKKYLSIKLCSTYANCQNYISNKLLE